MSRYTKSNHRIFMQFVRRDVWHVTFLEPGLQTPLPKTLTFTDEEWIYKPAPLETHGAGTSGVCSPEYQSLVDCRSSFSTSKIFWGKLTSTRVHWLMFPDTYVHFSPELA
jgi:hypothetical protein